MEDTAPCIVEQGFWGQEWGKYWSSGIADCTYDLMPLLPRGKMWPRDRCTWVFRLVNAIGNAQCMFEQRVDDYLFDVLPWQTTHMLPEWEALLGLPEACFEADTIEERRAAVIAKLLAHGSADKAFFQKIAEPLGFEVDFVTYADAMEMWDEIWGEIGDDEGSFTWFVVVTGNGNKKALECLFNKYMPLHIKFIFVYE